MGKWKGIVGQNFTLEEFQGYVEGLSWDSWRPEFIVLHHTAVPSLAMRPQGITPQQIENWVTYYRDEVKNPDGSKGWSAGPHLFVDDRQIWVFTPLTTPGVHAKSFNSHSLGVEMLGNYDVEDFDSGRGAQIRDNAVAAIAILSDVLGLDPDSMKCHRDEPSTTKTCPGNNVDKAAFIQAVKNYLAGNYPEKTDGSEQRTGEALSDGGPGLVDVLMGEAWGVQTDPASPGTETGESASQAPSASPDHFAQTGNMVPEPAPAPGDGYRVATAQGLNIRSGPGTAYEVVGAIPGGEIVTPLETTGWLPVLLDDNSIGWLTMQHLQKTSAAPEPEPVESGPDPEPPATGAMKTSQAGLEFIKNEEGCILHVYNDPAGYPTIGVGHLIKPGEEFTTLTEGQALALLAQDLKVAEAAVNRNVQVPLTQNQFDALVSFTFNCGAGALEKSTLLKLLNQGEYEAVPQELMKWVKAAGKTLQGLVNRRQHEGELWDS